MLAVLGSMALSHVAVVGSGGRAPTFEDFSPKPFPKAWEYISSDHRFNAVLGGRRGGKTVSMRARTVRQLARKPGSRILYITLIKKNCRKLYWHPLKRDLARYGWSYKANETDLSLTTSDGGYVEATSCENMNHVARVRGDGWDLVLIDECQEPRDDVQEQLVEHVLVPSLVDKHGGLDMGGTPPPADVGFFVEYMKRKGTKLWGWTMFDNPNVDAEMEVQELFIERGIVPGHPIYEREIMGKLVTDPDKLAYEYKRGRNDYTPTERQFEEGQWRHSMGLDLGFQDNDAIVVLGWRRDDAERRLYERFRWQANHLDVDALAIKVREAVKTYRPVLVGDHGGHGAVKVLETLKARMGLEIHAKPTDVMASVGLVNDDFRAGRLLLEQGSPLADELVRVTRTLNPRTGRLEINKQGFHSDLSEALRYAHHAARHWASRPPKPEPTVHDRRRLREQELRRREADPDGIDD